jgi:actin-related protein 3
MNLEYQLISILHDHLTQCHFQVIQSCPIDYRRTLYKNVVLTGGNTLFVHFQNRLQRELRSICEKRREQIKRRVISGGGGLIGGAASAKSTGGNPIEVSVTPQKNRFGANTVWFGGSVLAGMDGFEQACYTQAEYAEWGPNLCYRQKR